MDRGSKPLAARLAGLAVAASLLVIASAAVGQDAGSGRALAEKFAEQARKVEEAQAAKAAEEERAKAEAARIAAEKLAAEAKRRADETRAALEQLKRDEAEMLHRARAERQAEIEARRLAQERIEKEKAAEAARIDAERKAEDARQAEIRRQEAEREQRRIAEEAAAAEKLRAEQAAAMAAEAERQRAAEAERQAETARQDETRRKALEADREAEMARISEVLRRAREAREALAARRPPPPAPAGPPPPTAEPAATQVATPAPAAGAEADDTVLAVTPEVRPSATTASPAAGPSDTFVTVLLIMEPGSKGIRRFQKTADPILCVRESCYISAGPNAPAVEMPRWKAFGTGNTLGKRSGACRNMLTCVFRNVDLGEVEALIQPVDMRIMRHDRRDPVKVRADQSCSAEGGRLHCSALVVSKDWRAWVLPERVAQSAGIEALQSALQSGLPRSRSAGLGRQ